MRRRAHGDRKRLTLAGNLACSTHRSLGLHVVSFRLNRVPAKNLRRRAKAVRGAQELAAARFIVQSSPNWPALHRSHVALVTDHLEVIGHSLTAELHAGVLTFADEPGFQSQLEVTESVV